MHDEVQEQLITGMDLREYFRDSVNKAVINQNLIVQEETIFYVVNMMTEFSRSERFYEKTTDGLMLKALALIYADALEASSTSEKNKSLQRLGDLALFISGLFADSLNRSLVDIDYYIAMGGTAYACLADQTRYTYNGCTFSKVFGELSEKFIGLVDVLAEISEKSNFTSDSDVLRLYELWMKTGSKRLADKLQELGIQPFTVTGVKQ
ncbi:MAG: hypothetical protein P8X93_08065 [Gammaproteobacteria bacterium]